ncbi:tripartite tricarboxylate transporter substrate binding protein [Roseomonas terrae]|jgi:tripartite-type tricarboxylate transporter receptor subunit TctC|uniref:Tripartite tricarboxylate transporter substrate binding protein n=1 Tax=Neoroseomonas terrae TaxID=424799 RepID=A0ABS5EDI5_9PROT|nr:tripartite tricarboxylate transporter substrate binding protein [Neoroseomonas terrae]MBR0649071.1 tripartite tricarboxylate transporter substrate binding protein [Neoroseomonas terrae]
MLDRRALLAATLLAAPAVARAQGAYPARPIRVVVPFAAGGIIDVVARIVSEPLSRRLGQTLVIENTPGAGSTIGVRNVMRAAPDGYTLLLNGAAHSVIPALYPDAGIDPVADFAPIALLGEQPFIVAVHPSVPATDVPSLLAWLRSKRGEATFATTGIGAASHLAGELLKQLAGVDFTVVQYRGTPAAVTDFVAGRVEFMIDSQTLLEPLIQDGRARGLAVTTARRSAMVPNLPTLQEAGIAGYESSSWQALYAPAGTPPAIVRTLSEAALAVLADPTVRQRYAERGVEPRTGDAEALRSFLKAEMDRWLPILRATGARAG